MMLLDWFRRWRESRWTARYYREIKRAIGRDLMFPYGKVFEDKGIYSLYNDTEPLLAKYLKELREKNKEARMDFERAEQSGDHYHYSSGEPCSLQQLVRAELEWAATRIKQGEIAEKKLAAALAQPAPVVSVGVCPHYFEDTDGVHVVVVGQCRCKGKIAPAPAVEPCKEQEFGGDMCDTCGFEGGHYPNCPKRNGSGQAPGTNKGGA
jgi:hypothetical protein